MGIVIQNFEMFVDWLCSLILLQILGTGMDTQDTSPSVLLFFDHQRFIFNAGEVTPEGTLFRSFMHWFVWFDFSLIRSITVTFVSLFSSVIFSTVC